MRHRAHRLFAALLLVGAVPACSDAGPEAVIGRANPGVVTPGQPVVAPPVQLAAKEPIVEEAPPEPEAQPETIVPGGPNDPWGPILCPGAPHPAHHRACQAPARAAPAPSPTPVRTGGGNTTNIDIGCESGGDYAANTGNGYYGAYQFLPSTWRTALQQALDQGRIVQEDYDRWVKVLPHQAPPWVQDAAAAAHVAAGSRGAWPNC